MQGFYSHHVLEQTQQPKDIDKIILCWILNNLDTRTHKIINTDSTREVSTVSLEEPVLETISLKLLYYKFYGQF